MGYREECIENIRKLSPELKKAYDVTSISLFGSVARDEATEKSDVDLLVEMAPNWLNVVNLKNFLEEKLHKSVDIIRKRRGLSERFINIIQRDAITIF